MYIPIITPLFFYLYSDRKKRINDVRILRTEIINLVHEHNDSWIDAYWSGKTKDWCPVHSVDYYLKYSFEDMLNSDRPLFMEFWLSPETLNKLKNEFK